MTTIGSEGDLAQALGWSARRYLPLVALLLLGCTVASVLVTSALRRNADYTATSLVIATTLTVRQEQLPRLGESVFAAGSVARDVAARVPGTDFRTLVPERISVDPVPDSIAFRVQGHSADAQEAADLANAAANAFVVQLNRAGAGVGSFVLQDPAFPPLVRSGPNLPPALAAVLGLAVGSLLSVALLSFVLGIRAPVLTASAAAEVVEGPALGVLRLAQTGVPAAGIRALALELARQPSPVVELAVPARRADLAVRVLAELEEQATRMPAASWSRRVVLADDDPSGRLHVLLPSPLAAGVEAPRFGVVAVVPEGASRRSIRRLLEVYAPEELLGVVLVRHHRRSLGAWLAPDTVEEAQPPPPSDPAGPDADELAGATRSGARTPAGTSVSASTRGG